jgi:branched-chain amino acid transport system permease protein
MELFLEQVVDGLAMGGVYGSLALGMVLIFRTTGILNFAQGEMALVVAFVVWQLNHWGVPLLVAIVGGIVLAFVGGALIEFTVIRRLSKDNEWGMVILTFGLFLFLSNLTGFVWGYLPVSFGDIFPADVLSVFGVSVTLGSLGTMLVVLIEIGVLTFVLHRTKLGLAMRATVSNRTSASLVGINVRRMSVLGWGIASSIGAIAAILAAPTLYIEPGMMFSVLLYALAAAALGGFDSLLGAVVASLIIGVSENLAATYIPWIGSELKIAVPLAIIFAVLVLKPSGLFGSEEAVRV